jgi:hypothetical protein
MVSAQKPPVAIRITRPYETEDEFFARELDTISRTGVMLVGAQPRPEGVVLRFELALASGTPLLRGEGRVIGYKQNAIGHEPGLSLRFTRLDSKSKALVDRVGSMREVRPSMPPPAPPAPPPKAPEPPRESGDVIPISLEAPVSEAQHAADALAAQGPSVHAARAPEAPPPESVDAGVKESALARLRNRRTQISRETVDAILSDGAARRRG